MKKILFPALLSLALCGTASALENTVAPAVTDIQNHDGHTGLIIGNSYSFYNCGIHGYLRGFTKEDKRTWKTRLVTISSAKLSWHDVERLLTPFKGDKSYGADGGKMFDVVFLQGNSTEPINAKTAEGFKEAVKKDVAAVKAAGSEPIVVMTWARQNKPETTKDLADATIQAANEAGAIVLPVGLAFAESLKGRPDLILHQKDKSHPSAAGSYLYGALMYSLLFKKSPEGMKFLGECEKPLSPEDAAYLQKTAWNVAKEFYGWK